VSEIRAALYARVSTEGQTHDLQLDALRLTAAQRGWLAVEFVDVGSGAGKKLPERDRLLADARSGKIDLVCVWKFDRFSRSLVDLVTSLDNFRVWGVQFVSLQDNIDTSTASGKLLYAINGAYAEYERSIIRERVQAGVEAARRRGRVLGRPRRAVDVQRALRLREEGRGWRSVARVVGVPVSTLRRAVAAGCAEIPLENEVGNTAKTLDSDHADPGVPKADDFGTPPEAVKTEEEPCDGE
jgi:DNA invertase Pin-like site-specific DNA recombinase